ncbi:acyl-dehydrogenase [Phaffia rhodozyma]|uniref:Acyl-dehydrogenase n=1 Tax=Phaffia rhodozyma TaxID=264483 RepID=A0A0F7SR63_PHARH|nr:acyl-dehydrogenase [Phaffia rhodozyma]
MSKSQAELQEYTFEEVAKHNKEGDLWVVVDSIVYNLSVFSKFHPGGKSVLFDEEIAGQDATEAFFSLHRHEVLLKPAYQRLQIGKIQGQKKKIHPREVGGLREVPYAEPTWLSKAYHTPYYNDTHRALQKEMRKMVDEHIYPDAQACEDNGKHPSKEVIKIMADKNVHAMRFGPGKHLHGLELMGGIVEPKNFDYFHELVITQEIVMCGARGYGDGLGGGNVIGLPPVINFGSKALKEKVVPEILKGEKFICLAVSEAFAGSDVTGLRCSAVKSEDGKSWVINGTKKWITGGVFADYFTVACRTSGGLTVLLVPRGPGVETKPIKTRYSSAAGTAYVTFDNVTVSDEYRLGGEDAGIYVVLSNFNHERWVMCCSSARSSRAVVEECLVWANQRKVFGKPLIAQPVIRYKLASMIAKVEAVQSWLENVTYQMTKMSYKEQSNHLAGQIAFLKMYSTRVANEIMDDAVQIFGGRSLTKTGMGKFIEMASRTQKFDAILGGAEDVLGDLGVRQAQKKIPKGARL